MSKPFYVTTPIYYVNDRPHIGHTYTTVLADVIARHHRMLGEEVYFLTGTDEHGQKVEKAAAARSMEPKALADEVVANYHELWKRLGITHDRFIRTTDEDHRITVQNLFRYLLEKGAIYKGSYKGLYSVSDEAFVTETQAKELQAQGLAHQLVELEEETYFFRLSAYQERLLQLYEEHPGFVQPDFRLNEVKRFVQGGLQDLSISRTSIAWGIPVPEDDCHVVYVWFDALLNYLSGAREGVWPPDLQLVGKDILRFHAVYWPAFLLAAEMPLPTSILAHGWWLMDEDKMSKSKGNVVRPDDLLHYGNDAMRYFFLREMRIGHDQNFSTEAYIDRLNADLANGLGNLSSRTLSMIQRYCEGIVPVAAPMTDADRQVDELETRTHQVYLDFAIQNHWNEALDALWAYFRHLDGYIVQAEPWKLAKDPAVRPRLESVLYRLWKGLRLAAAHLAPVMPDMAQKLWSQCGLPGEAKQHRLGDMEWTDAAPGRIGSIEPLFLRIEKEKTVEMSPTTPIEPSATLVPMPVPEPLPKAIFVLDVPPVKEVIDYESFAKTDLRVGLVLTAEAVPKSKKLIKMTVDLGFEQRTIVGGIATAYAPEELVGKRVVVVANLAPVKLMGVESHGMLLAASDANSKPFLIAPPEEARPGFIVK